MTGSPTTSGKADPRPTHARRQVLAAGDAELVDRYRRTLRAELVDTLQELRPEASPGLFGPNTNRPALSTRRELVTLARSLVAALSAPLELDTPPEDETPAARPRTARRRIDFG